jgi:DNA-binding protein H-NS
VARQLATRTVIEWFGHLSFDQQNGVMLQMQQKHEEGRSAKRAELEKQLAALGYTTQRRRGRPKAVGNRNGPVRLNGKKRLVKAKYRDPKTKETWSGRGRMASWLKSKRDAGEKIDKYLI